MPVRTHAPVALALSIAALAIAAPAAHAGFGVSEPNWEAGTCKLATPSNCEYADHSSFYTNAAGHPLWGITKFTLNHSGSEVQGAPLKRIRVDIPPGLAADPQVLEVCSEAQFDAESCPAGSKAGTTELTAIAEPLGLAKVPLEGLTGNVYNLGQRPGLPLLFGIDVAPAGQLITPVHLLIEGHVAWSSDYHEWFQIDNVPTASTVKVGPLEEQATLKIESSQLNFEGRKGGSFITLPSECSSTTTSLLEVESYAHEVSRTATHTPVGVEDCGAVPFGPSAVLAPETSQYDSPDGVTTEVRVPQHEGAEEINTADVRNAQVTLPEGLTLNPSAAHGLQACTQAQLGKGSENPVSCPAGSKIGTVTIETDLPAKSLSGDVYLGKPDGTDTIGGPPYLIFLDAESAYGVSVRLQGMATPDPTTGRLTVSFADNPPLPFSDLILTLDGGAHAPLANPLGCGPASADSMFAPWTGLASFASSTPFATSGCPSPVPFALAQATPTSSSTAGAFTSYAFTLSRSDGQQFLSRVQAILPPGLVGLIPSVTLCGEPQAQQGACPASSQIGTATVAAGAGGEPYSFTGPVYLTGAYDGSPFGLSVPVQAAAGPFDLGRVITRAAIGVDPYSARVVATATLPTIVGGVPLRLRSLTVDVNRSSFLLNPTSCQPLATNSLLTSTAPTNADVSSPFSVSGCASLPFKPAFSIASDARTSKLDGAALRVRLTQPGHQANIGSVVVALPKQLPSRLTTLQQACPEATFAADPTRCPTGSRVGSATVRTPVLAGALTGPAYLVSHGGAAFPDLDLVLDGSGVRVILVGATNIRGGVTTSTFASIPDVPVSSFALDLPVGPHSALTGYGDLCARALQAPTTITAQNGAQIKQSTRIAVAGCGVRIVGHRFVHHKLLLTIHTRAAGRIIAGGRNLTTVRRRLARAITATIKLPLSRTGQRELRRHRRLQLHVRVGFAPAGKSEPASSASAALTLER